MAILRTRTKINVWINRPNLNQHTLCITLKHFSNRVGENSRWDSDSELHSWIQTNGYSVENCPHGMFHGPEITLNNYFKTISAHFNVLWKYTNLQRKKKVWKNAILVEGSSLGPSHFLWNRHWLMAHFLRSAIFF